MGYIDDQTPEQLVAHVRANPADELEVLRQVKKEVATEVMRILYPRGTPARVWAALMGVSRATYYRQLEVIRASAEAGHSLNLTHRETPVETRRRLALGPVNRPTQRAQAALRALDDDDLLVILAVELKRRLLEDGDRELDLELLPLYECVRDYMVDPDEFYPLPE